jgi:hypothetical protein
MLPNKRNTYNQEQRKSIIDLFERSSGPIQDRVAKINAIPGYEKITHNSIVRWSQKKEKEKLRRKVSVEFENEIAADLLLLMQGGSHGTNAIYSYDRIKSTAILVRDRDQKWKTDPLTMSLKFSNKWVSGFLKRIHLTVGEDTSTSTPPLADEIIE